MHHLPAAAHVMGMVSRPVLRVVRASLRPFPSERIRFSFGTRTFLKVISPFSIPRSPMNSSRCSFSTPSHEFSTMKALMGRRDFPSGAGVRAMTTMTSATGALVHQSFSPFRM